VDLSAAGEAYPTFLTPPPPPESLQAWLLSAMGFDSILLPTYRRRRLFLQCTTVESWPCSVAVMSAAVFVSVYRTLVVIDRASRAGHSFKSLPAFKVACCVNVPFNLEFNINLEKLKLKLKSWKRLRSCKMSEKSWNLYVVMLELTVKMCSLIGEVR